MHLFFAPSVQFLLFGEMFRPMASDAIAQYKIHNAHTTVCSEHASEIASEIA